MNMRRARRAILSVPGVMVSVMVSVMVLVSAFAYPAAAQPRPASLSAAQASGLPAAYRLAARYHALPSVRVLYAVRSGDTLSGIAARYCNGIVNDWTGIFAASRAVIGPDPNLIRPGQLLTVKCTDPPALLALAGPARRPAVVVHSTSDGKTWDVTYGDPNYCGDGDGDGWDVACAARTAPAPVTSGNISQPAYHPSPAGGTYHGSSSMQQCIISRESGGNSQVMNSTGHYGLYQFSASTWAGSGGNPADFGNASVAEQNQVFANAVAARGYSDWAPYDGC